MYENVQFEIAIFIHFKTAIDSVFAAVLKMFGSCWYAWLLRRFAGPFDDG